jgi:hypothetical protein
MMENKGTVHMFNSISTKNYTQQEMLKNFADTFTHFDQQQKTWNAALQVLKPG